MKFLRPKTILRLNRLWPHARKRGHEIGQIYRVGYYICKDGFDVVWLVDSEGNYNWTADPKWVYKHFEVIEYSKETSLRGRNREALGPLRIK
jgi:hypothetical protein